MSESDFDDPYFDEGLDDDDFDEDVDDCALQRDGTCEKAGSEECDECPFNPFS